jgi:hypothetical protein
LPQADEIVQTRNQKPETRNQKPETRNQKPETRNQKPETRKGRSGFWFGKSGPERSFAEVTVEQARSEPQLLRDRRRNPPSVDGLQQLAAAALRFAGGMAGRAGAELIVIYADSIRSRL